MASGYLLASFGVLLVAHLSLAFPEIGVEHPKDELPLDQPPTSDNVLEGVADGPRNKNRVIPGNTGNNGLPSPQARPPPPRPFGFGGSSLFGGGGQMMGPTGFSGTNNANFGPPGYTGSMNGMFGSYRVPGYNLGGYGDWSLPPQDVMQLLTSGGFGGQGLTGSTGAATAPMAKVDGQKVVINEDINGDTPSTVLVNNVPVTNP